MAVRVTGSFPTRSSVYCFGYCGVVLVRAFLSSVLLLVVRVTATRVRSTGDSAYCSRYWVWSSSTLLGLSSGEQLCPDRSIPIFPLGDSIGI